MKGDKMGRKSLNKINTNANASQLNRCCPG